MAEERSRKRPAVIGILVVLIISLLTYLQECREWPFSPSLDLATNENNDDDDNKDDDGTLHLYKYAYVIVTYHKSGHQLSHTLRKYLMNHSKGFANAGETLTRNNVSPRINFNHVTKCSQMTLPPGTITVIEAPEFHCTAEQLEKLLLDNPEGSNPEQQRPKWGIKMIHLVRNPFSMAVSNYHYHSQDPTPEPYVHHKNPCSLTNVHIPDPIGDLVTPLLSNPNTEIQHQVNDGDIVVDRIDDDGRGVRYLPERMPIMTQQDFTDIVNDCNSLYRTEPELSNATYYEHLLALPPEDGLRMATTDKIRHVALMASDMIMFDRVRRLERQVVDRNIEQHQQHRRHLDLITMPMEEWINHPSQSMDIFLEFVFHNGMTPHKRKVLSGRYQKAFLKKKLESNHITSGKYADTAELEESLRGDGVFGGPLSKVEELMNDVLHLQSVLPQQKSLES